MKTYRNSLFIIKEGEVHSERELIRRYSRYKYGAADDTRWFADKLVERIRMTIDTPRDYVVVNPPYSSLPPAIMKICRTVARRIKAPFVDVKTLRSVVHTHNYAQIADPKERQRANDMLKLRLSGGVRGKRVILVEDAVTTGATVETVRRMLLEEHGAKEVLIYTLILVVAKDPSFEDEINSYIHLTSPREFYALLPARNTFFNRYTVKSIFLFPKKKFGRAIAALPRSYILRLARSAKAYFNDHSQDARIGRLLE